MTVRDVAARAYREALPALAASTVGGLFAGWVLGGMRPELRAVPGLLVLVPALLATRGNVYGALGARLASALHQGLVEPAFIPDERVWRAIVAAIANGLTASAFAAVVAFLARIGLEQPVAPLHVLATVALVAGLLSGLALTLAVVSVVFVGYRRGHNPDTLVGPIVTTTGDVFGLAFLVLAVRLVVGGVA
jgi:mgtE-like transporter